MSDTDSMRYKSLKYQKKISAAQIQDGIMGYHKSDGVSY